MRGHADGRCGAGASSSSALTPNIRSLIIALASALRQAGAAAAAAGDRAGILGPPVCSGFTVERGSSTSNPGKVGYGGGVGVGVGWRFLVEFV